MRFLAVVFTMLFMMSLVGCADSSVDGSGGGGCSLGDTETCACLGSGVGLKVCGSGGAFGPCEKEVWHHRSSDQASEAAEEAACEPIDFDHKGCHAGDVFWFNTCGEPTAFVETCDPPQTSCHNGGCVTGCVDMEEHGCDGEKVVSMDSCGEVGDVIQTCHGGATCEGGSCVEECVGGSGGACTPNQAVACPCVGGSTGVQSCNADGSAYSACDCGGTSGPCEPTTAEDTIGCFENAVYWFDDCSERGAQVEACSGGESSCVDGACQEGCVPYTEKKCNEPGTGLFWFDSCGNQGDLDQLCPENTICAGDDCIAACEPHAAKFCLGDQVYWYNSCDEQESVAEACTEEQFCKGCTVDEQPCSISDPSCVKPLVDGVWTLVADPDQLACGFVGNSFYPPQDLQLVVDGSQAIGPTGDTCTSDSDCADIEVLLPPCLEVTCDQDLSECDVQRVENGPQVCGTIGEAGVVEKYVGTLNGKKLKMDATWDQVMPGTPLGMSCADAADCLGIGECQDGQCVVPGTTLKHNVTMDVDFSSLTTFEGWHIVDVVDYCILQWQITGTKK